MRFVADLISNCFFEVNNVNILFFLDFHISIMWERYLMVFTHCILAVVGILMYFMMTKRSNLVGEFNRKF